ncbi:helicase C-terminal domain-containing protein [Flavonifractor plautii]|nr:helicase C-terminal domain-containing protein [Flavonifractor plautii]
MTSSVAGRGLQRPLLGLSVVPFQLAYTVSIHKAQGLEYNSAKEVIPSSNSEQISHGIFYTAITRAKEKLKIFLECGYNQSDYRRVRQGGKPAGWV